MEQEEFTGTFPLQISPKIIQHISSSMYRSPSSAIKELLINSFDADATEVELIFSFDKNDQGKPKLKGIEVRDDGSGMDGQQLRTIFSEIGDSLKSRIGSDPNADLLTEKFKRPLVGRLGIGILAIASSTSSFEVITKKADSEDEFVAEISITQFDKAIEKVAAIENFPMGKVKIIKNHSSKTQKGYTRVVVSEFKPPFMALINHDVDKTFVFKEICTPDDTGTFDWEKYFKAYLNEFYDNERISKMEELDKAIIQLGNIVPVRYLSDGPVRSIFKYDGKEYKILNAEGPVIKKIKEDLEKYNFNVKVSIDYNSNNFHNSFYIFKPQLFPTENLLNEWKNSGKNIDQLKPNIFEFSHKNDIGTNGAKHEIEIRGYAYHQNSRINPREFRGLLYRVYNVTIGEEYKDDLRLYSNNPIALHQTSIEIYLDKGFQSVVNIDRESFYQGGDAFQYLKAYLEHTLSGGDKFLEDVMNDTIKILRDIAKDNTSPSEKRPPQVYEMIANAFNKTNNNTILSQIKKDMKEGLSSKRYASSQHKMSDPVLKYVQKKNIAEKSLVIPGEDSETANLTVDKGIAIYKLPSVKSRNKSLFEEVVKFTLLSIMKDGESSLNKDQIELLVELINTYS